MSSIDERIVKMKFDNAQFEKGIDQTTKSLGILDKKLRLENGAKGFNDVEKAANRVSLDSIAKSLDTISHRFTTFGIIATTALQNITNSAINTGKKIVGALTIDGAKLGFQEYETQMNAIQTILANTKSKGTTLNDVNKALDELNHYADMTIYNFTQMTSSIGSFTAAGVDLETSVSAIKGISNLAGISGANADQAATSMYQLSQAISAGTLMLEDWNSVVNAGMGGEIFQEALKETARVHGIEVDKMIEKEGSFRLSLSKGWVDAQILTETLAKFTGDLSEEQLRNQGYTEDQIAAIMDLGQTALDATTKVKTFTQLFDTLTEAAQSGWTQTWQILIGDFETAKGMMTDLSDYFGGLIGQMSDARNELLQGWADLGGRTKLIEAFKNVWEGILSLAKPIREAFRDIFPDLEPVKLWRMTDAFQKFSEKLKLSGPAAEKVKRIFKGLFSAINLGINIVKGIASNFFSLLGYMKPLGSGLLDLLAIFGDWITNVNRAVESTKFFENAIGVLTSFIGPAIEKIGELFRALVGNISSIPGIDLGFIQTWVNDLVSKFNSVKLKGGDIFDAIALQLEEGLSTLDKKIEQLKTKFAPIALKFKEWLQKIFDFKNLFDAIAKVFNVAIIAKWYSFVKGLADISDGVGDFIEELSKFVKEGRNTIKKLGEVFESVGDLLNDIGKSFKAQAFLKIAFAIGVMALSLVALSNVDSRKLIVAINALGACAGILIGTFAIFNEIAKNGSIDGVKKITTSLIPFAAAIVILSKAVKTLSSLNLEEAAIGVGSVISLMMGLSKSLNGFHSEAGFKVAIAMIAMSQAIRMLVAPLKELGSMNIGELSQGLLSLAGMMISLTGSLSLFSNNVGISSSLAILSLTLAIKLLVAPLKELGSMNITEIGKALLTLGGALFEMAGALAVVGKFSNFADALSLSVIILALNGLSKALYTLSNLSMSQISAALIALGGALAEVVIAANLLGNAKSGARSLGSLALALIALAIPIKTLSGLSIDQVGVALAGLGGVLAELGIYSALMAPLSKELPIIALGLNMMAGACTMLAIPIRLLSGLSLSEVGVALVALGGAFAILGAAAFVLAPVTPILMALSIPIGILAVSSVALATALSLISGAMANFSTITITSIATITATLPLIGSFLTALLSQFGAVIAQLIGKIIEGTPQMLDRGMEFIRALAQGISSRINEIFTIGTDILLQFLRGLSSRIQEVTVEGTKVLVEFLRGLKQNIGDVVSEGAQVIVAFLNGLAPQIPSIVEAGVNIIVKFLEGLGSQAGQIVDAAFNLIIDLINALSQSMEKNIPTLLKAALNLGKNIIKGILNGLADGVRAIGSKIKEICDGAVNRFKDEMGIHSPSKVFFDLAQDTVAGLTSGLGRGVEPVEQASEELAQAVTKPVKKAVSQVAKDVAAVSNELAEEIKTPLSRAEASAAGFWETYGKKLWETKVKAQESIGPMKDGLKELEAAHEDSLEESIDILDDYGDETKETSEIVEDSMEDMAGAMDEVSEASEDMAETFSESTGRAVSATEEFAQMVDIMDLAGDVVNNFQARYSDCFKVLGDTAPMEASKAAVTELAFATYSAAEAAKKAEDEMAQKTEETVDKMKEIQQSFLELRQGLVDSITSQISIFDEFDKKTELTGQDLLKNMESQINGVSEWADNLQLLAERGIDQGLLKHLAEMGPQGYEYVNAFATMTKEQIEKANTLFGQYLQLPEDVTTKILSSYSYAGLMASSGFANGILSVSAAKEAQHVAKEALDTMEEELDEHSPSRKTHQMGIYLVEGLNNGIQAASDSTKGVVTGFATQVMNIFKTEFPVEKFTQEGQNIIQGLVLGIIQATVTVTNSFQAAATAGMNALINGFKAKQAESVTTIRTIIEACLTAISQKNPNFTSNGRNNIASLISGFKARQAEAVSTMRTIITKCLAEITNKNPSFTAAGRNNITSLINGFKAKQQAAVTTVKQIMQYCLQQIKATESAWKQSGENVVNGFIKGIKAKQKEAEAAARAMARAAAKAAREEFDEHSPSKVFEKIGKFAAEGLAIGMTGYTYYVENAGKDLAEVAAEAVDKGLDAVEEIPDIDDVNEIVITPVIDQTELDEDLEEVKDKLVPIFGTTVNGNKILSISNKKLLDNIKEISLSTDRFVNKKFIGTSDLKLSELKTTPTNKIEFVQNNYSPKALSRVEIYRDTKNQLSLLKNAQFTSANTKLVKAVSAT